MTRVLTCLFCLSLFAGCATVAPYERERLSQRDMDAERSADLAAGMDHATAYREGSSGGMGSSAGGCGCN
jgi:hypothetical protein